MYNKNTSNCIVAQSLNNIEIGKLGENGEPIIGHFPRKLDRIRRGQRVRSTCYLERDSVKKRQFCFPMKKGKGPKSVLLYSNTVNQPIIKKTPSLPTMGKKGEIRRGVPRKYKNLSERIIHYFKKASNLLFLLQLIKGRKTSLLPAGIFSRLVKDDNLFLIGSLLQKMTNHDYITLNAYKLFKKYFLCAWYEMNVKHGKNYIHKPNSEFVHLFPVLGVDENTKKEHVNFSSIRMINMFLFPIFLLFSSSWSHKLFASSRIEASTLNEAINSANSLHNCLLYIKENFSHTQYCIVGTLTKNAQISLMKQSVDSIRYVVKDKGASDFITNSDVWFASFSNETSWEIREFLSDKTLGKLDYFISRLNRICNLHLLKKREQIEDKKDRGRGLGMTSSVLVSTLNKSGGFVHLSTCSPTLRLGGVDSQTKFRGHMEYIRYSSYFLIGFSGSSEGSVTKISRLIRRFLKVKLKLQLQKNTIVQKSTTEEIPFLGYLLMLRTSKNHYEKGKMVSNRKVPVTSFKTNRSEIHLVVDMGKVVDVLSTEGFCDRLGNPKPNFRYFQISQKKTVVRAASLLRGLSNYYQLAENKRESMTKLSSILTNSLAMMFAAKFKLKTRAKVFSLAGRNLVHALLGVRG